MKNSNNKKIIKELQNVFDPEITDINYAAIINKNEDIEKNILKILLRSRNLISSLSQDHKIQITEYITNCVKNKAPIKLSLPFGAYKNKHSLTFPFANWAEAYAISFILEICNQISNIYEPGILISIHLQDFLIDKMNNIPQRFINSYIDSFMSIMEMFSLFNNQNVQIQVKKYSDILNTKKFENDLNKYLNKIDKNSFDNKYLIKVEKNLYSNNNNKKSIIYSAAYNRAFFKTTVDHIYGVKAEEEIVIIGRKIFSPKMILLPLRSYYNSRIQFWVGDGAVVKKKNKNTLYKTILSTSQKANYTFVKNLTTDISNPYLKSIPLYNEIQN